ncbi:MAG TPA: glycogen debranching enzyme N-terminal domain-containing protein, partial [Saprospiraceae bacterium]|nr:glycogen debranching enzyme N-terminal domain-containing protein [Saprospiraceae bacterium]
MLKFEQPEFDEVTSREWIVTNGLGGYASSSICGANTRRYHGLLVASFNPPTDRRVLVSKLEETIIYKDLTIPISTNAYPGAIHPKGFEQIESFDHDPFPKIIFRKEKAAITKSVFMRHGFNTTIVEYANTGKTAYQLQVVPLLVYRDDHHLFHESAPWTFVTSEKNHVLEIIPAQ